MTAVSRSRSQKLTLGDAVRSLMGQYGRVDLASVNNSTRELTKAVNTLTQVKPSTPSLSFATRSSALKISSRALDLCLARTAVDSLCLQNDFVPFVQVSQDRACLGDLGCALCLLLV
jgi:hypothetical protein